MKTINKDGTDSFLDELRLEYKMQDNRATAYPIYVTVQELVYVGVMADDCGVYCPYGDGETAISYRHPDFEDLYENESDLIEEMHTYYEDKDKVASEMSNIESLDIGYIWVDREFFLTIKGAEEYIKANGHNLGKTRTYVHHFSYRNKEMNKLFDELGLRE